MSMICDDKETNDNWKKNNFTLYFEIDLFFT